jgi:hypothetical protein
MDKKRRWQFSLRDICLLMVIVALAVSWWVDDRRLANELAKAKPEGWIIDLQGFTLHQRQAEPQIEPVETQYHHDLSAFFKQLKMQGQGEAVEAFQDRCL